MSTATDDAQRDTKRSGLQGGWGFGAVSVVVAALVFMFWMVLGRIGGADGAITAAEAGALLGVIVPAMASIGGAIFGIRIAYDQGEAAGEKSGEQKGKADGEKTGRRKAAAELLPRVQIAADAMAGDEMMGPAAVRPELSALVDRLTQMIQDE